MIKKILLSFLVFSCVSSCKKEKVINQVGNWNLAITYTRTYVKTNVTESGTWHTDIYLYEDYTGLYSKEMCRWFILGDDKLIFVDMADYTLPSPNDETEFTILVDEPDHQVWQAKRVDWGSHYNDQKWELHEK